MTSILKRKPISDQKIRKEFRYFSSKKILITGGAGSIGSELCRQVALLNPKKLIIIDVAETELFYLEKNLLEKFPKLKLETKICDIRNWSEANHVIKEHSPDIIFHAAAYKHIIMMERNPKQAIMNNVLGTKNLALAAKKHKVKKFLFVSTDKAAEPKSIMGSSKRITEIYLSQLKNDSTQFIIVRFGNVLGSRGSVVPIFQEQIEKGGPITITDEKMERYFMTTPDAVYLMMQAAKIGKNKEMYIFNMGKPVKIIDLAKEMISDAGLTSGKDIEIIFIGRKDGEKINESLLSSEETIERTKIKKLLRVRRTKKINISNRQIERLILLASKSQNEKRVTKAVFDLIKKDSPISE